MHVHLIWWARRRLRFNATPLAKREKRQRPRCWLSVHLFALAHILFLAIVQFASATARVRSIFPIALAIVLQNRFATWCWWRKTGRGKFTGLLGLTSTPCLKTGFELEWKITFANGFLSSKKSWICAKIHIDFCQSKYLDVYVYWLRPLAYSSKCSRLD